MVNINIPTGKQNATPNTLDMWKRIESVEDSLGAGNGVSVGTRLTSVESSLADIATNAKTLGLVGNGIADDTIAMTSALNSNSKKILFPNGTYKLTDTLLINAGANKKIIGSENTVFSINLASSKVLFDLDINVAFENITFDFNNSYCKNALLYKENLGLITLKNVTFKNVKDIDSTTSSILVWIPPEGNSFQVDGLTFDTIKKRGNGNITDGNGSINGFYYGGTLTASSALGGIIQNVTVNNFHNINSSDVIIYEDTTGIYIATNGKPANVEIKNVKGYEFGKRLIKIQSSKTKTDNVYGESYSADTLGVVGVLAEYGVFDCDDAQISNVTCKGVMEYAVSTYATNSKIRKVIVDTSGNDVGLYIDGKASNTNVKDCDVKSNKPIVIGNNTVKINNLAIKDTDLTTLNSGYDAIATNMAGYSNILLDGITLNTGDLPVRNQNLFSVPSTVAPSDNLRMRNITFTGKDAVQGGQTYARTIPAVVWNTTGVYIDNFTYLNTQDALLADAFTLESCSKIVINELSMYGKFNRGLFIRNSSGVNVGKVNFNVGSGVTGDIVFISDTDVTLAKYNERYKIVVSTMDVTELLRSTGTTANRPKRAPVSFDYFDTTLGKPVFVKTFGVKEVDTLTVSAGATASGNITITLNGVSTTVAVASGDSTGVIGDKIRATTFSGWTVGGTAGSATVTFTKNTNGTNSAPAFADTGTTGTSASFTVTTAGTNNVWVDSAGTTV